MLNFIVNIINMVTMTIIWIQYRKRFAGIQYWLINMILHSAGIGLILVRDTIPGFLASVVANTMLLSGAVFILIGLQSFSGKKGRQVHNYILLIVYFLLVSYFFVIRPDMVIREIVLSVMIIVFFSQSCWLLMISIHKSLRQIARIVGIVMAGYVIVSIIRIVLLVIFPLKTSDFFKSGLADAMAVTSYLSLHILLIISLVMMVTRRLLVEVKSQEEKFTKAFHSSPYAILLTKRSDGIIFEVNDGFVKTTGYQRSEVVGRSLFDLNFLDDETEKNILFGKLSEQETVTEYEIRIKKRSGDILTGLLSTERITIEDVEYVLSSVSDISEHIRLKNELLAMATHDSLTGLPNRRLFNDRFEMAIADSQRTNKKMAVLAIDLDRFKQVNDTLGHAVGDMVLFEAAHRLQEIVRKTDTVARFGGDEFMIVLRDINSCDDAVKVAGKIVDSFRDEFIADKNHISLSASIGISIYPEHGGDMLTLLRKSDEALYITKDRGRDGFTTYGSDV